jgi:transposase
MPVVFQKKNDYSFPLLDIYKEKRKGILRFRDVADAFDVSTATASRWIKKYKDELSLL